MRLQLIIEGRVQGVWYRASTQTKARALGVTGWVRNLANGSVQAEVQGAQAAVDALVAWCKQGPRDARVTSVEVQERPERAGETGFVVR